MTEEQLKYQGKVRLIAAGVLIAGLLLILLWSVKKNETPKKPANSGNNLSITYSGGNYEYKCKNANCALSSQAGIFALVNDGGYHLINLSTKTDKEVKLPTVAKNYMLAGEEFYGLVYTKGESNFASFYEASKDRSLFDDELSFEAMDKESVREALIRLYPRGYFYVIKESSGQIFDINNNSVVAENVVGCVVDNTDVYIVNDKGVLSIEQDNSLLEHLNSVKKVYPAMYDHKFVVLDNDGNLKLAAITGEIGDTILETNNRNVQSVVITNTVLKVVVEDVDYATNQKVYNYEYDFTTKQLKTIE
jgi:hypothetical protein